MESRQEALGIPSNGYEYMSLPSSKMDLESQLKEFYGINNFLLEVVNSEVIEEFRGKDKRLQFINYGNTELVYVLTVRDAKYTLLLGQPSTKFGEVRKEYENLKLLSVNNPLNIVRPIKYFKDAKNQRELYVTPYFYQARCIGIEETEWGIWIPEPEYHFREFSELERSIINSSMIALLVKFYDDEKQLGIGSLSLDEGDFILEKGYENNKITYENVLKMMKLIAARKLIQVSLDDYIETIRSEFSRKTHNEGQNNTLPLINRSLSASMTLEEIETGIEIGYRLREKQKGEIPKKHI